MDYSLLALLIKSLGIASHSIVMCHQHQYYLSVSTAYAIWPSKAQRGTSNAKQYHLSRSQY
jgi:multidrug transporter EmrE-like cation transporter